MVIELNNEKLRVRLVPKIGGSIIECSVQREGQWISLLRTGEDPLTKSSNASSFVMIPYSNRLRNGCFSFAGQQYRLRFGQKHSIHGDVRDRPLLVKARTQDQVMLEFDPCHVENLNFPFPFCARVTYELQDRCLISRIEVINSGTQRMPAGCGLHPYFNRKLPGSTGEVEVQLAVKGVYPGDSPLPDGPAVPIEAHQDFSKARPLDIKLDHCFAGWDRKAAIVWPGSGVSARLEAETNMEHIVLYSPPGKDFFALEPVTNANDGFNLFARGDENCGVVVLNPGESLATGFRMHIDLDPVSKT